MWQPLYRAYPERNGKPVPIPDAMSMWQNDQYVVFRREVAANSDAQGPMIHLSIRRQDRAAATDWRDFQRIKNQLAGDEYEGLEIYPAESRKVDTANQYHLWCLPFSIGIGLGTERMVSDHDTTSALEPGAVQRDNEEVDGRLNTPEELEDWLRRNSGNEV